ncbi:MAG TPA: FAD-binding oxidoreductase [Novosphingobium sp.]|nr:FAD-binding oxidoreductase [Novosphingobium sp.]
MAAFARKLWDILAGGEASLVPGVSRAHPVESDKALPSSVDVAVIGGGIIGVSAALYLAKRGFSVAVFEKGAIAGEASGRNHGLIEGKHQDLRLQPLIELSKQCWRNLDTLTGEETGFREHDIVEFFNGEEELAGAQHWIDQAATIGLSARVASASQVDDLLCGASSAYKYAFHAAGEGIAEPKLAAPAIAMGARKHGALIFQQCAVRGFERLGRGICAIVTERGTVRTGKVILAGGVWTPTFLRSLGIELPMFGGYASIMSLAPFAGGPDLVGVLPPVVVRRELDGGYAVGAIQGVAPILPSQFKYIRQLLPLLAAGPPIAPRLSWSNFWRDLTTPATWRLDRPSPFEKVRILQPETQQPLLDRLLAELRRQRPEFMQAQVREAWSGALVSTIDDLPVLSGVSEVPGLFVGTGFTYGFTMGPGAGAVLAQLAAGEDPGIDLSPFQLSRFAQA